MNEFLQLGNFTSRKYIFLLLFLLFTTTLPAWSQDLMETATEISIPTKENTPENIIDTNDQNLTLIEDFYANQASLARSYDYELLNQKKRYLKWSNDVKIFSFGLTLGIVFTGGFLAVKYHWSLGWYIPVTTAIAVGGCIGALQWAKYYAKKASAIQLSPIYSYSISESVSVSALALQELWNPGKLGFGVGITKSF